MIAEWNDAEGFQKHLEDMLAFRRNHPGSQRSVLLVLNKTPVPCSVRQYGSSGNDISLLDARGNPVVVPIWKIELMKGSEN